MQNRKVARFQTKFKYIYWCNTSFYSHCNDPFRYMNIAKPYLFTSGVQINTKVTCRSSTEKKNNRHISILHSFKSNKCPQFRS